MTKPGESSESKPPPSVPKSRSSNGSGDLFEWARTEPGDEAAWNAVDDAARDADSPREAEALYHEVLEGDLDAKTLSMVGRRAIEFLEEWYEDTKKAVEILQKLIAKDPENTWAFEKLSLLLTLAERWDDLLGTYDHALERLQDVNARIHLLEEAARIAKDFAGQAQRASDYLKQLLLLRPDDEKLASSLERRLEQQGRYRDLVDIWQARLSVTNAEEQLALRIRIGDTLLDELGDAEGALASAKGLLNDRLGQEAASGLLERLSANAEIPLEARREGLSVLKTRYREESRLEDVVRILNASLELAPDDRNRIQLNQELVECLLELERPQDAQSACSTWLALAPDDETALEQLRALAEQTGSYGDFANALVAASRSPDPAAIADAEAPSSVESSGPPVSSRLRVRLLIEAAETQELKALDEQAATNLFARVLLDPGSDNESRLLAARRLTGLLTSTAQGGQRLDVLEKLSVLEPDAATQVQVLGEAAELAEKLGDPDRALGLWDRRLEKQELDSEALDAKVRILARIERYEPLQATLRARFRQSESNALRRADLVWIAKIYEEKLKALDAAIDTWKEVEAHFGRDPETVDALVSLFTSADYWTELIEFLSEAVEQEDDRQRQTRLYSTLGDVFREQRQSTTDAVNRYRLALELDPTYERARAGLTALLEKEDARHLAAETLAKAYAAADEWRNLLDIAETRLSAEQDKEQQQAILLEAASLLEQRAENPSAALGMVRRAFALIPDKSVEERMLGLALQTSEWSAAVDGYQEALRGCDDLERTTELLYEQGRLLELELAELDDALSAFRRILELDNDHTDAAAAAIRCAGAIDSWQDAAWALVQCCIAHEGAVAKVFESFATAADQEQAWERALLAVKAELESRDSLAKRTSHDLRFQLAVWYRDRLDDFDVAEQLLRRAVADHTALESLSTLAAIQRRHPDRDFVETLLQLADADPEPLPHLDEAARVAIEHVADRHLAHPILTRTLVLSEEQIEETADPDVRKIAAWCLEQLLHLAEADADYSAAFNLLMRGTRMNLEPSLLLSLKHRAAEVAAHKLKEPARAIALCREVLVEDPGRSSTVNLLASLFEQETMHDELLRLREQELRLKPSLERRLELRLDMARVQGILGEDVDGRVKVLGQNLAEQLGHPESIDALAEMLAPLGRYQQLFEILCEQADQLGARGAAQEAAALYARAGLLAEQTLDDVEGAIETYSKATELAPDLEVLDSLASIHSARDEFNDAVERLLFRLELTPQDQLESRRSALVRLGKALRSAGRSEEAIAHLTEGIEADAASQTVRELLVELHEERAEWPEFATLLAEGVPYAPNEATKVDYLTRSADVRWHKLKDLTSAIPLLEQARKLQPEAQPLRLTLADALRQAARYDEARELLEGLLAEFGRRRTPERATVHFQLALIARATHELDEALSELDAASKIQRSEPLILKTLGDVAREKGELERAERAYRALLLLVGRGQSAERGIGESAILFELYRIAVERNDEARAKDLLDSAVEAADQDPAEALRLERALYEAEQWPLLLAALERRKERASDKEARLAMQRMQAEVLERLERLDEALELRFQLLESTPTDQELLSDTETLATRCQQLEVFTTKLKTLAEQQEEDNPQFSCDLWLRLGRSAQERGELPEAARLFRRAQGTTRRPSEVFHALWQVHEATGDTAGMVQALEAFVEAGSAQNNNKNKKSLRIDPKELLDAQFRLAELELRDAARRESGVERLRGALESEPAFERAATILEAAIEDQQSSADLVNMFLEVARHVEDQTVLLRALRHATRRDDTTLSQLQEAVQLADTLGDEAQVSALLSRCVEFGRQHQRVEDVQWALVRLSEQREAQEEYREAAKLLEEAIEHCEGSERFELELRLGALARNGVRDWELAARVYERLAEQEPSDARAWKPLLEIYREVGQTEKLEACLSRAEEHVIHDEQRRAIQLERIRLLIDAERLEEAETSLQRALEEAPDNDEACDVLLSLLERKGNPEEIRDLLSKRLQVAMDRGDDDRIVQYALRLGSVLEQEDMDGAVRIYQTARNMVPGNRDVLTALLSLTPEGETQDRADIIESILPTEPADGVESLTLDLARLRLSNADEPGIERAFELGFKLNPKSHMLRERLETWYRERDEWLPLAELLALDASTREKQDEAISRYKQAAEIYETHLGDANAAAEVLEKALALDPIAPDLLEPLSQYLLTCGQGERAIDALTRALNDERVTGDTLPTILHLRAAVRARMDESNLGAIALAIDDLDQAKQAGGQNVDQDLASLLMRQRELGESANDDASERAAVLRLSQLLPELDRAPEALDVLASWMHRHEDDEEAISLLAKLSLGLGNWQTAMDAHQRLFDLASGSERVDAALRFAEACEHCGDPMGARAVLEQVRAEVPNNEKVSQRLYRMYEAAGAHAELAGLLLTEAEVCEQPERKYALLTDAAELLLKTGEPHPQAVEALELALGLVPSDHRATVALSRAYAMSGRIEEACAILEEAIKAHGKRRSRELSELQHAMSIVAGAAGDDEGRYAWLEAALQSDRKNGAVASELAIVAMERGEYDGAIKALQLITLLKDDCPMTRAEAYFRQSAIAHQRGDHKKAVLLAKRALTADSEYEPAREFLEQLTG